MTHADEFAPCWLVEHEDGTLSLCFDDFDATADFMERYELQGGGYTWEAVVESLVRLRVPELLNKLEFDAEGSMFCAYGHDKETLKTVAHLIREAQTNESLLAKAVAQADPELLE